MSRELIVRQFIFEEGNSKPLCMHHDLVDRITIFSGEGVKTTVGALVIAEKSDSVTKLEQCVGVKDKNGKFIFERDIVTSDEYLYKDNGERNYDGEVCWDQESASFFIYLTCVNPNKGGISDGMSHSFGEYVYEVVGNIHQNKRLEVLPDGEEESCAGATSADLGDC